MRRRLEGVLGGALGAVSGSVGTSSTLTAPVCCCELSQEVDHADRRRQDLFRASTNSHGSQGDACESSGAVMAFETAQKER
jgi:hypothetical protein